MSIITDKTFLAGQYQNAANLNARIALHTRFSENKTSWFAWVFNNLALPEKSSVLELGCGSGELWRSNQERIPPGWELILSDFSPGMAAQARENLTQVQQIYQVVVIDAQTIPLPERSFSAVIANHMLYHVADRPRALAEIRRVLRGDGYFYAATIGKRHLVEIHELVDQFDLQLAREYNWGLDGFTLENGAEQLASWFPAVRLMRYPNRLLVTEAEALADYILSNTHWGVDRQHRKELIGFIQRRLEATGVIEITIDTGMYIASRS